MSHADRAGRKGCVRGDGAVAGEPKDLPVERTRILGAVLTGAVITETIFAWPGVGRLLVQSIGFRDYPMVQGCILLIAVTYVGVNLVVDLLYVVLDPRIRYR